MAFNNYYYPSGNAVPDVLNGYKMPYQQPYQQPMQMPYQNQLAYQPQMPVNQSNNDSDIIWVMGEAAAQSYPVAKNTTITLWDKNNPTIYIKSADINGVPSMRILDFTERQADGENAPKKHECTCANNFINKEEFATFKDEFQALKDDMEDLSYKYEKLSNKLTPKKSKPQEVE